MYGEKVKVFTSHKSLKYLIYAERVEDGTNEIVGVRKGL